MTASEMPRRLDLFKDMSGMSFGRLSVIRLDVRDKSGQWKWLCLCQCGRETSVVGARLRNGGTRSCGCLTGETASRRMSTHGLSKSTAFPVWRAMIERCCNPANRKWRIYGGRGICVCDQWRSFPAFLRDMGERPRGSSLDRINSDGNYCKENCRWATAMQQNNNKRTNRRISHNGRTMTMSEWAREIGATPNAIHARLMRGWAEADAVSVPVLKYRKRSK